MITAETILARAPTAAMQASDVKVSVYPDKKQCVNKAKGMLRDRLMWETRWKRIRNKNIEADDQRRHPEPIGSVRVNACRRKRLESSVARYLDWELFCGIQKERELGKTTYVYR